MQQQTEPVALITGASKGIGNDIARKLSQLGYAVAIGFHHSSAAAEQLYDELRASGKAAMLCRADVSDSSQVNAMVQAIESALGPIDVLINNAGISQQRLFTDITDEDWKTMLEVNLSGAFYCSRAVLPGMISKKSGHIINISSIWGMVGASCEVHYSAAKAGLIGLTKALAKEVGPCDVRVNCIAPGVVRTAMNECLSTDELDELIDATPLGMLGGTADISELVAFLLGSGGRFITGQVISPNGGFVI